MKLLSIITLSLFITVGARDTWIKKVTAFKVSNVASNLFVANRSIESIKNQELAVLNGLLKTIPIDIDMENKTVSAKGTTAYYHESFGVTLSHDLAQSSIRNGQNFLLPKKPIINNESHWPEGNAIDESAINNFNADKLNSAIDFAFEEPFKRKKKRNTRAVLVIHKGKLVAERYAEEDGFFETTAQVGNSMTKSILNAMVALRVKDGKIDIESKAPIAAWQLDGDSRKNITINNLLQMSSGLETNETKDVIKMVYCENDMASFAEQSLLSAEPNSKWYYSSLTSNILSGIVRNSFDNDSEYWQYPYSELFYKLGMNSALFETDATGTFIGSSFFWATPKDWARFGQLYLQNGIWNGEQILPEGWVDYTTTPADATDGRYGAHFWLNKKNALTHRLPAEIYQCRGLFGQQITIVPSKELVIVRFGYNTKIQKSEAEWLEYKFWTNDYSCSFYQKVLGAIIE